MSEHFETGYQAIPSNSEVEDEDNDDAPPSENIIHVVPDKNRARWNHVENLDEFFSRVYQFHQRSGFTCMVVQDIFQLLQFAFVVLFSVFLIKCVDYETLFYDRWYNGTSHEKVTIPDGIYSADQCLDRFGPLLISCLLVAAVFWLLRLVKCIYNIFLYVEIRAFYLNALKITANELPNMTWHEVQCRIVEVQAEQQMCIHKKELNELDIYNRILRFKNYMVAMVNKDLLPLKFRIPVLGQYMFLTTGLKYNLEIILFWGPWAPFENHWHLHSEYKIYQKRKELAEKLSQKILLIGIANFVMLPLIMLWQILYSFFRYAEIIKRQPGALGARRWSMFARLYVRHFNELDHELDARLNRGYRPAQKYMDLFISPLLTLLAKNIAFVTGSMLAVLVILTIIDEDFLQVQHVFTVMSVLAAILAICRACIPEEHVVWCPEYLMKAVLAQIHYIPDSWKNNAHTYKAREEFSTLYQYKCTYLLEELLSPLLTPFILVFCFRHKALDIVDFYRNFTVDVQGVGDVCSFAQMDIRKHGNPQWVPEEQTDANQQQQGEGGKTEMSLYHFTLTNPLWKPPQQSINFINSLKDQIQRDAAMMSLQPLDNPLANSLHSLTSAGIGYNSLYSSTIQQSAMLNNQGMNTSNDGGANDSSHLGKKSIINSGDKQSPLVRGGVKNAEGPLVGSGVGLLASLYTNPNATQITSSGGGGQPASSLGFSQSFQVDPLGRPIPVIGAGTGGRVIPSCSRNTDQDTLEYMSAEMSFSALYMHELHRRRVLNPLNPYFDNEEDAHARAMWSTQESKGPERMDPDVFTSSSKMTLGQTVHSPSQNGGQLKNDEFESVIPLSYNVPLQQGQFTLHHQQGGFASYQQQQQLRPVQGNNFIQSHGQTFPVENEGHQIELQPINTYLSHEGQTRQRGSHLLPEFADNTLNTLPHVDGRFGPHSLDQSVPSVSALQLHSERSMPNIQEENPMDLSEVMEGENRPLIEKNDIHDLV